MAKLVFDQTGQRFYQTGVSNGVLYPYIGTGDWGGWGEGVAWNGLTSVSETPDGGDENAFYADNIKYLSLRGVENFGGTIKAYTYPDEWAECDGSKFADAAKAVRVGQQTRKAFCFAYKTQIGNDLGMNDDDFMLHIIYNATSSPSDMEFSTINESPEPTEMSWEFKTTPVVVGTGYKPTSILTLNSINIKTITASQTLSGKSGTEILNDILDNLYGRNSSTTPSVAEITPHILLPAAIIEMLAPAVSG